MSSLSDLYLQIPYDLSGAISKNRNRNEMLWGLKKIYDLYGTDSNFVVIFDNKCDVEVVLNDNISFYQIKTRTKGNYTLGNLLKVNKGKKESILSTLFSLNNESVDSLNIVSNVYLSLEDDLLSRKETISFADLSDSNKQKIAEHIRQKLNADFNFEKVFYIRDEFCISRPDTLLLGETVRFLSKLSLSTNNVEIFYNYMQNLILNKASYEYTCKSLNDAMKFKGISQSEIKNILTNYNNVNEENYLKKFESYIGKLGLNVYEMMRMRKSYGKFNNKENLLVRNEYIRFLLSYIDSNNDVLQNDEIAAVNLLKNQLLEVELDECDRRCLAIMTLIKMEVQSYEGADN